MSPRIWIPPLLLILLASAWLQSGARSAAQPPEVGPPAANPLKYLGAGSCASMACHNGQGPAGALGSEYTTWAAHNGEGQCLDKHSQAYDVLFNEVVRRISKNLLRPLPPHEDPLCLNCHVIPEFDRHQKHLPAVFARDGVGCESCHGPAEQWIAEHHRPDWQRLKPAEKEKLGMKDTQSLAGRAKLCAGCHVGSGTDQGTGRDVNHDLYGAGHPPLVFEFAAFHAALTHHWQDYKDKDPERSPRGHTDFEARAWVVGQLVSAHSSFELLTRRAGDEKRWPEFAEFDCFACHHDLKAKSWRRNPEYYQGRKAGALSWRMWYATMVPRAAGVVQPDAEAELKDLIHNLRQEMEKPAPDPAKVAARARQANQRLTQVLAAADHLADPLPLQDLYRTILTKDSPRVTRGWDEAGQVFLSLASLHNAWTDMKQATPPHLKTTLQSLSGQLHMPPGYKSPKDFDAQAVKKMLDALAK